jgi:hypothetical protein
MYAEEAYDEFQPPYEQYDDEYAPEYQYEEDIEPTETDFDDEADLDEGTVIGAKAQEYYEPPQKYSYKPKASAYAPVVAKRNDASPVMKVQRAPVV